MSNTNARPIFRMAQGDRLRAVTPHLGELATLVHSPQRQAWSDSSWTGTVVSVAYLAPGYIVVLRNDPTRVDRAFPLSQVRSIRAEVPYDYPVKVLGPDDPATDRTTCGECHRSWDDAISTGITPTPAGRCPFESYH